MKHCRHEGAGRAGQASRRADGQDGRPARVTLSCQWPPPRLPARQANWPLRRCTMKHHSTYTHTHTGTTPQPATHLVMHHVVHVTPRQLLALVHKGRAARHLACRGQAGGQMHRPPACERPRHRQTWRVRPHARPPQKYRLPACLPTHPSTHPPSSASSKNCRSRGRSSRRTRSHTAPAGTGAGEGVHAAIRAGNVWLADPMQQGVPAQLTAERSSANSLDLQQARGQAKHTASSNVDSKR
jgi:hypothetical protein